MDIFRCFFLASARPLIIYAAINGRGRRENELLDEIRLPNPIMLSAMTIKLKWRERERERKNQRKRKEKRGAMTTPTTKKKPQEKKKLMER